MIERQQVVFLMISWFLTGRQLGHVGAKYARRKKESMILLGILLTISLILTFVVM